MPQRAKVSMVVCSAMFMAGLDLFIVNLAFPRIGREFHGTSLAALSWVLSAYAIVTPRCSCRPAASSTGPGAGGLSSSACLPSLSRRSRAPPHRR